MLNNGFCIGGLIYRKSNGDFIPYPFFLTHRGGESVYWLFRGGKISLAVPTVILSLD